MPKLKPGTIIPSAKEDAKIYASLDDDDEACMLLEDPHLTLTPLKNRKLVAAGTAFGHHDTVIAENDIVDGAVLVTNNTRESALEPGPTLEDWIK